MKHQARKSLSAGPGNPARLPSPGVAMVPHDRRRQSRNGGVSNSSALKRLALAVLAAMALMAVPLTSLKAATATYAILFVQEVPEPNWPPNPCGTDHCGLFSFETGGLADGAPVSPFAADFAFFDTRSP